MRLYQDQLRLIGAWIDLDLLAASGELQLRNLVIEKSRQIGATWCLAAVCSWLLHHHRVRGLYRHQREADVIDTAWSVDSFLGKVRFVCERLDGYPALDYRPASAGVAMIIHPSTGATLRGECKRDDTGRGQTLDFAIVDEAAHIEHAEAVHASLDDACPTGKVYVSTPRGEGSMHARLADSPPAGWQYLRLHWSAHPVYGEGAHIAGEQEGCELCEGNRRGLAWSPTAPVAHRYPGRLTSPWYERAIASKTDEQVARELDIDRAGALSGRVYPELQADLHVVREGIAYDPELRLELGFDFGLDVTAVVVCQDAPEELRVIGLYETGDLIGRAATPERVSSGLVEHLASLGVPERLLTRSSRRAIACYGDPAAFGRSLSTGRPLVEAYARLGWVIRRPPPRYTRSVETGIGAVKRLLLGYPKPLRICGRNARTMADRISHCVWPTDRTGERRLGATRPVDDLANHACDALRYLVLAKWPPLCDADAGAVEPDEAAGEASGVISDLVRYGMSL